MCRKFGISSQIAYLMADNASNNDRTIDLLSYELPIDPKQCRLRCAGYINNLVTKAILFGTDVDCIIDVLSAAIVERRGISKTRRRLSASQSAGFSPGPMMPQLYFRSPSLMRASCDRRPLTT